MYYTTVGTYYFLHTPYHVGLKLATNILCLIKQLLVYSLAVILLHRLDDVELDGNFSFPGDYSRSLRWLPVTSSCWSALGFGKKLAHLCTYYFCFLETLIPIVSGRRVQNHRFWHICQVDCRPRR